MNDQENSEKLEKNFKQKAFYRYVDDTVKRLRWLAGIIAIAEFLLIFLDFFSGFFSVHYFNILNLFAEIMLVTSSIFIVIQCEIMKHRKKQNDLTGKKMHMIVAYRIIIMASILLFAFTDIYVRQELLGTYLVFLFVLQITPAYRSRVNWIQFLLIGAFIMTMYCVFVSFSANTLFGTCFIFLAFAISTDFLRSYFARQLEDYYRAETSNQRFHKLSHQAIFALANAVEAKDLYTKGHSQRVAEYSKRLAELMGYNEDKAREVYFIGLMHDVGKIGVPDEVINKKGRLTDEEFAEIKKHPSMGYDILKQITELPGISEGARWHHERYDGKGYPDGLAGENIPKIARIIAVADAYDAMTSNRSYRQLMEQSAVREQVEKNAGTQFDPDIAKLMLQLIDEDKDYKMHE